MDVPAEGDRSPGRPPPLCPECGEGRILLVARAGRKARFKRVDVEIPAEFAIPTCNRCGAEAMTDEIASALDAVLETAYWATVPQDGRKTAATAALEPREVTGRRRR